ncbi:MAG: response regulator [Anaerolineae bacterium]
MSTILIIDDDVNALKLLGYTLRKAGFGILVAQNGFEGLEKAETQLPDLIVSDLMMPKLDGYEVTRRLRANQATKHIPIIMLTAKSQVHDKVAGFEAGVNDYVTKPIMPAELIARIKAHLARRVTSADAKPAAKIVSFLGAKGGVGVTTLVVNLGLALQQSKRSVILVDFQTTGGAICQQMGEVNTNNLLTLLKKPASALSIERLKQLLLTHKSGVKMLPTTHGVYARYHPLKPAQAQTILTHLGSLANFLLVDLGTAITKTAEAVLRQSHQICIVTEPTLLALDLTKRVGQYLTDINVSGQHVGVVSVNRSRSAHTFTLEQIKATLKMNVWGTITPAPELAFQSVQSHTPMIALQPNHITTQQIQQLVPVLT